MQVCTVSLINVIKTHNDFISNVLKNAQFLYLVPIHNINVMYILVQVLKTPNLGVKMFCDFRT